MKQGKQYLVVCVTFTGYPCQWHSWQVDSLTWPVGKQCAPFPSHTGRSVPQLPQLLALIVA